MEINDEKILHQRLYNQGLRNKKFKTPVEAVKWLGAVQAQDYPGAKWALHLRLPSPITDDEIENAISEGKIIRTHILRPTWHFVAAEDVRWMLALSGPRVENICSHYYRKIGLDKDTLKKSEDVIINALKGNKHLTRLELRAALQKEHIDTNGLRFGFILAHSELNGIICSGARKGRKFTYALLDEIVPKSYEISREDAVTKLVKIYFTSHGPATIKDFVWWSGLTVLDAKAGIESLKNEVIYQIMENKIYFSIKSSIREKEENVSIAHFLPNYDEYIISYKDRSVLSNVKLSGRHIFNNSIIFNGKIIGSWKRIIKKNNVFVEAKPFFPLNDMQIDSLKDAIKIYEKFNKTKIELKIL